MNDVTVYQPWINKQVRKKSNKPFKSGLKIATVKNVTVNENIGKIAFSFYEDDSVVNCEICRLVEVV